jgi:glycerophosphoryl diester phosphodiesterase
MPTRKPCIIGHRGARGLAPENTLEGFEIAIQSGVDMIETDVRLTADGQLVLVHDEHLTTADKRLLRVMDTTLEELKLHHSALVTLDEAINFVNRRVRLMVEVKPGVPAEPVAGVIEHYLQHGWQTGDFMFNSSHYKILRALMDVLPDIERVIQGNWSGVRVQYLARKLRTPYILLDQRYLWWGYVYMVSKRFRLITYTYPWFQAEPYNHLKAKRWVKYGLWGLVTDYPDRFTT